MNLLFTICARAGSKGLKSKNIKEFLNIPLPYYTLSVMDLFIKKHEKAFESITIAVNTDSQELLALMGECSREFLPVPRKPELATDTAAKIEVIKDTLRESEKMTGLNYDIITDLDLTSPLRTLSDVEAAIETAKIHPEADVVFSVTNSRRNPYFNMVKEEDGYFKRAIDSNFTARQQAPLIFDMNASIYAYNAKFLKNPKPLGIFDGKALVVHMMDTAVLDIDSEEDFELMQILADYFYQNYPEQQKIKDNIISLNKKEI